MIFSIGFDHVQFRIGRDVIFFRNSRRSLIDSLFDSISIKSNIALFEQFCIENTESPSSNDLSDIGVSQTTVVK